MQHPQITQTVPAPERSLTSLRMNIEEYIKEIHAHVDDLDALADRIFGAQPKAVSKGSEASGGLGELSLIGARCDGIMEAITRLRDAKQRLMDLA